MNVKQDLEPPGDAPQQQPPQAQRRPRGFAAMAAAGGDSPASANKGRKERDKEKERTKLRERHRRAITSRMLAGFRQYGNFQLHARADMNDVLAALARQAGWTVEADGTTYRSALADPVVPMPSPAQLAPFPSRSIESPPSAGSLKNSLAKSSLECQPSVLMIDECLSPASLDSAVVAERDLKSERYRNVGSISSSDCIEPDHLMQDIQRGGHDDFSGTSYVPVYATLPTGVVNSYCQLVDPEAVRQELRHLKSLNMDGVVIDCWWGIVEGWSPQKYSWSGYRDLFNIVREFKMKTQVVMAFHECGASGSGDVPISLPKWVLEVGKDNQDIFFTDRGGRRNTECISWGVDGERVLCGRTGIEVYFDFMRSFRAEFDDLFAEGLISGVEVGLGASGELKFPSFPERMGWRYPGIGEFQCYDRYLQQSLGSAAKGRGQGMWALGPENAGHYNARPQETSFFCDRGDYDSHYGRFFLRWYSNTLVAHADRVLSLAEILFHDTLLIVKIPAVYWWYKTASHAAELTAGYYNPANRDGYAPLFDTLKKHSAAVKLVCPAAPGDSTADADGLTWQVVNAAWDRGLTLAGQNSGRSHDKESLSRLLETAKPPGDPDRRHFAFLVYHQPTTCFVSPSELHHFVKSLHGIFEEMTTLERDVSLMT